MTRHPHKWLGLALALAAPSSAVAQGLPHTFTPGTPAHADEVNENFRYVAPKNIVYVSPVDGGSEADNGAALRAALDTANLTAINGAPAATNRYLVKVAPGVYDVGTNFLRMHHHVDLMGSGTSTVIRGASTVSGTVRGATNCTLGFLTVEASGGGVTGIHAQLSNMRIQDVDVRVTGSPLHGTGIHIEDRSIVEIRNVNISVAVGASTGNAIGLNVRANTQTPATSVTASNMTITVSHNHASNFLAGVTVNSRAQFDGSNLRVRTTNANAASSSRSYALHAWGTAVAATVRNSVFEATGGSAETFPVYLESAGPTVKIHHSVLVNHSGSNFLRNEGGTVRVGASQAVPNAAWVGTGVTTCAYIYNSTFAPVSCINLV